ncbi:MAG: hypothetical protein VKK80_03390, partial [Prochlorothrix sp.]|nr:hypothetical protein [Prochlorothrix sp.]
LGEAAWGVWVDDDRSNGSSSPRWKGDDAVIDFDLTRVVMIGGIKPTGARRIRLPRATQSHWPQESSQMTE